MTAIVEIDEQNGNSSTPVLTHNISNSNMGSSDEPNLNPLENPIAAGESSFEKWQLIHIVDLGTSSKISNLQIWRTGALGANAIHVTNASTTNYGGTATYIDPIKFRSNVAVNQMPTSAPGSPNLGIGGSLAGVLSSAGYSDFLVHQIQTSPSALSGNSTVMNYQYDETA